MTVLNRIATIRLSEKLERNPKYAEDLGISIVNRKTEMPKENILNQKLNENINKGR